MTFYAPSIKFFASRKVSPMVAVHHQEAFGCCLEVAITRERAHNGLADYVGKGSGDSAILAAPGFGGGDFVSLRRDRHALSSGFCCHFLLLTPLLGTLNSFLFQKIKSC